MPNLLFCVGKAVADVGLGELLAVADGNPIAAASWFGVACELHRDWRNDVEGVGRLFSNHLPAYRNLITTHGAKR